MKDESMMNKFEDMLSIIKNQSLSITQQENILNKLVVPLLSELVSAVYSMNLDMRDAPIDADFKVKMNRLRAFELPT